jgi:hypothetical protein
MRFVKQGIPAQRWTASHNEVRDDLESIFYVIILIMVTFEAPGRYKAEEELEKLHLDKIWWNPRPED